MAPLHGHGLLIRRRLVAARRRSNQHPDPQSPPRAGPHRWPGLPPPRSRFLFLRRRFRIRNPARRCSDSDRPRRPFHPFR
ncbi:hypothetical protein PVAP13_1KG176300 [Panicum virgatum]|uniref:Uncharacterized protein n=1 Tax=Panicum virgatum TaxID=38727 RepID=A0A8T0XDD7_PANVG|nr:hypothetical protein PVAP13_1KG176300 [Panicum virgatum]